MQTARVGGALVARREVDGRRKAYLAATAHVFQKCVGLVEGYARKCQAPRLPAAVIPKREVVSAVTYLQRCHGGGGGAQPHVLPVAAVPVHLDHDGPVVFAAAQAFSLNVNASPALAASV